MKNKETVDQRIRGTDGNGFTRRGFLVDSGVAALVTGLAACMIDGKGGGDAAMDASADASIDAAADAAGADASVDSGVDAQVSSEVFAANLSDVAEGAVVNVSEASAFLLRDADGLYAMSSICTHMGCLVSDSGADLVCPCHASQFDYDGNVTQGPAILPLPHYLVTITPEGDIYIDVDTTVTPDTRLPV